MEVALLRSAWAKRPAGIRSFEAWLICWLLLPNAGYWLLAIVGTPPRPAAVLLTGLIGILVNRAPFGAKFLAFLIAMIMGGLFFISSLFNLSIFSLMASLRFAGELSPSASTEYVACAVAVAATLAAAWTLLRRSTALTHITRYAAAVALTILAASVDIFLSAGAVGSYERVPDADAPFTSAVSASGFDRLAIGQRHLLLVMVEAMGQPTDPHARRRLVDLFATPQVRARYTVSTGDTLFYGSTTNGEMRELCGRWADYDQVVDRTDRNCLPSKLAAAGYQTQAWHSFNGSMFDRTTWYPHIGFERMRWGPELMAAGAQHCPGVFPGACDRDVPLQIRTALTRADRPQFLYWLTVNSHLPVLKHERLHTQDCRSFDESLAKDLPMTCRLLQLFGDVGHALAREISAPDFPPTDILIVGDHLPPFFDRKNREQFEPDRVPWILLRSRTAHN